MITKTSRFLLTPLTICAFGMPCAGQEPPSDSADAVADAAVAAVSEAALTTHDGPTDAEITDAVEDELRDDAAVPAARIDIETADGVVTLTGRVDDLLAKERACRVAQAMRGVRSVVDLVEVREHDRSARKIRGDINHALLLDPATESLDVVVDVDADQNVVLSGEVDSYAERAIAERVTKGVLGVRGVRNTIDVDSDYDRPDSELQRDVEGRLRWDRFIDDGLIDVAVESAEVKLTGTVGSAREKRLAKGKAWVMGVRAVDASGLEVARWARDPELRGDKYATRADDELRDAIRDAMLYDPRVASFEVDVTVDDGVVTLRGMVDNLKAMRAAGKDAENCVGVWHVDNRIKVRPLVEVSDESIREDVTRALLRDPWVERYETIVRVDDGVVNLSGTVDSPLDRARADDVASRVPGVVDVENHIVCSDQALYGYDPYVGIWFTPSSHDWFHLHPMVFTSETDRAIEAEILDEMWWSPYIDNERVRIEVDNGVATLKGSVESRSESQAAVENAYEGGAVRVDNELQVGGGEQ